MDFRRIPFQFTSTDPAKRQAELQKRFGLPVNTSKDKMHIDFENSGLMGFRPNEISSASNSPRLQHRVPVFVDGDPEPMKSSVESQGSPGRKPYVRVIPIEVEGDDMSTKRHRNLSGPANTIADRPCQNGSTWLPEEFAPYIRPPVIGPKLPTVARERTIPIQVEGVQNKKAKTVPVQKPKFVNLKKEPSPKQGFHVSKEEKPVTKPKAWSGPALSLNKIEGVLEKLKLYHSDIEKFTGTAKEKHYRYLDEMLTRLMLELDDIDTMGNEEVRLSRKAAIKQVQASLDLLEAKVTKQISEEISFKDNSVGVQDEVEENQDVEMNISTPQEENVMSNEEAILPIIPNENLSKLSVESVPETEQQLEVEDAVMENCMCDGQGMEMKAPEKTGEAAEGDFQIMEVDKNYKCEPVVTTVDNPIEESKIIDESKETINMPIELANKEVTRITQESEKPVVPLVEGPVKEMKTNIDINDVNVPNEETFILEVEPIVSSEIPACAEERITVSSQNGLGDEVSKLAPNDLETNEHSNITVTKHSPEVLNSELVNN